VRAWVKRLKCSHCGSKQIDFVLGRQAPLEMPAGPSMV
jgi:hypothetical protein